MSASRSSASVKVHQIARVTRRLGGSCSSSTPSTSPLKTSRCWKPVTRPVTSTAPRCSCTRPTVQHRSVCSTRIVLADRGCVVVLPSCGSTTAAGSSRSSVATRHDCPWWRYTAPGCTTSHARLRSTVPTIVPSTSTIGTSSGEPVPETDRPRGVASPGPDRPGRPAVHVAGAAQPQPVVEHQAAHGVVEVVAPVPGVGLAERVLERRARDMRVEHEGVRWVDHGRLRRP